MRALGSSGGAVVALLPLAALLALVVHFGGPASSVSAAAGAVQSAGPLAPLYFGLAYAAATVALLPASVLTLAAGALFGPAAGTALVSASSVAGATGAFLIARYAARPLVASQLASQPRLRAADAAIGRDGPKIVFLLRLTPLFPFSLGNCATASPRLADARPSSQRWRCADGPLLAGAQTRWG